MKTLDILCLEWFDKTNGNSYFSARVTVDLALPTEQTFIIPFQYGYDDHYRTVTMGELVKRKLIPQPDEQKHMPLLSRYCEENNIILRTKKIDKCKKSELKGMMV